MARPNNVDEEGPWYVGRARCRICSAEHVAVFPERCDEDNMECHVCHSMAAEVYEYCPPDGPGKTDDHTLQDDDPFNAV